MKRLRTTVAMAIMIFLSAAAMPKAVAAEKGDPKAGKAKYDLLCAPCHGNSGKGDGPAAAALNPKPRNHTDGKYMSTLKDDEMFKFIKEGGVSVGKSPLMPPWGAQLKDQDIWNVAAYIRELAKSGK